MRGSWRMRRRNGMGGGEWEVVEEWEEGKSGMGGGEWEVVEEWEEGKEKQGKERKSKIRRMRMRRIRTVEENLEWYCRSMKNSGERIEYKMMTQSVCVRCKVCEILLKILD